MTLSDRYRRLARLIDALESQGLTVRSAAPAGELSSGESSDEQLPVRLELELPSGATLDRLADTAPERVVSAVDDAEQDAPHSSSPERTTDDAPDPDRPATSAARDDDGDATEADAIDADGQVADTADDATPDDVGDAESAAETDDAADGTAEEETADDDTANHVSCTHPDCDRTFETDRGMKIHRTKAHSLSELIDSGTDEAVHCDPEVLAEVYEQYDTFAEMTDALDVDVGPQAVRKQMIRHDIHEPGIATASNTSSSSSRSSSLSSSSSGTDSSSTDVSNTDVDTGDTHSESVADGGSVIVDAGSGTDTDADERGDIDASASDRTDDGMDEPAASGPGATNGASASDPKGEGADDVNDSAAESEDDELAPLPDLDLPASLSADEFRAAVEDATTLYDVQRTLGLDPDTTRDLLREYDLLELVCGRAATVGEREELKTEIHERLQRAAT